MVKGCVNLKRVYNQGRFQKSGSFGYNDEYMKHNMVDQYNQFSSIYAKKIYFFKSMII